MRKRRIISILAMGQNVIAPRSFIHQKDEDDKMSFSSSIFNACRFCWRGVGSTRMVTKNSFFNPPRTTTTTTTKRVSSKTTFSSQKQIQALKPISQKKTPSKELGNLLYRRQKTSSETRYHSTLHDKRT